MELPTYVQIEPVGQCNLRCQMCPIQFRPDAPPAFMDYEAYVRLVDSFPTLRELHLQGLGEPLMHPRFFEMVAYAVARDIRVTTNTNLTLLTVRRARACVESGLAELHGSIDGATPETYERIRVRARFARVRRNLETLVKERARLGRATPRIQLVTVVMRQNLVELPALVAMAADIGVDHMFVQHLCHDFAEEALPARYRPMRAFVERETLLHEDAAHVDAVFAQARAVAGARGLGLRLPRVRPLAHPPGTPGRARCDWPWKGAYVSYDGHAMPCCMVSTPDRANFGNMIETGVAAVWNSNGYSEFRRALDSDAPPAVCQACSLYAGTF